MEQDLHNDRIGTLLRKMSGPAIVSMMVNGLYYLVDAAFVGWGVGTDALAGLAVIFPLQMFTIAWGSMIGMGTAAIVSLRLGKGETGGARQAASHAVILALVSGAVITLLSLLGQNSLLGLLGATAGTESSAREYLGSLQWGFVFVFLSMVGFNIARSQGKAGEAARGMLLGTVINLILDPLFIYPLHLGVRGAAIATVIARICSTLYFFRILGEKRVKTPMTIGGHVPDPKLFGGILALGIGNFFGQISFSLVAIVVNRSLRIWGTDVDLAVYGIISRIHVFVTMPLLGLAQGFQPVAGFNHGRGDHFRVREAVRIAAAAAAVMGGVMLLFPLLIPAGVMGLFCSDPAVIAAGAGVLRLTLLVLPVIGFQILGFAYFQALGNPRMTLILSLSRQVIFLIPLLLVLPGIWGVSGLWVAYPAADGLAFLLSVGAVIRSLRKTSRSRLPEAA